MTELPDFLLVRPDSPRLRKGRFVISCRAVTAKIGGLPLPVPWRSDRNSSRDGDVHYWHLADLQLSPGNIGFRSKSDRANLGDLDE
jgi:hypothetical protein